VTLYLFCSLTLLIYFGSRSFLYQAFCFSFLICFDAFLVLHSFANRFESWKSFEAQRKKKCVLYMYKEIKNNLHHMFEFIQNRYYLDMQIHYEFLICIWGNDPRAKRSNFVQMKSLGSYMATPYVDIFLYSIKIIFLWMSYWISDWLEK